MNFPKKCLVDTNVPMTANLATRPDSNSEIPDSCILACVEAVDHVVKNGGLVIDAADEIFDEYRKQLSMRGQPGVGDRFMKWVHDNRWNSERVEQIPITKNGESYDEFPKHGGLASFDNSDRKFVAAANAHPEKPPIFQATDSKWWGWKDALSKVGITIQFLCPDHIEKMYKKKMGS